MTAADVSERLIELGAATLGESGAKAMVPRIRAVWPGALVAAPAYPVRCTPGDNLAVHVGVTRAPAGSVLVVDVGLVPDRGYFGEVLTTAAEARGLVGLVIDGGVRDRAALEAHEFPVFATTLALRGATKAWPGTVGAPVRVGEVEVRADDWVVGDADGVVVVPGDQLDAVLEAALARTVKEEGFFELLQDGATTLDLLGLDASLVTEV
ncbi:MAG TPA: hypothetical protein VK277_05410 [Acidimicrobiales bacterium]|nr:hypothetical protein [Acidimicrobiales bacterium]